MTVDFGRLRLRPGMRALDLGCGEGRHVLATRLQPGIAAVAVDLGESEVAKTGAALRDMDSATPSFLPASAEAGPWLVVRGDTLRLPFADRSFDCVIAAEILEHLRDDEAALAEIRRVLRPGGRLAVSVPRFGPELVCWTLSRAYRNTPGGHVRIYRRAALRRTLRRHGFAIDGHHFAHALHAPFWWLKCAVGLDRDSVAVAWYHRLLVRDMFDKPWHTQTAERLLNPLIGKSEVFYAHKTMRPV
ncbi:MAG TPA: methyltransferase domain-containing protein [Terriglobales bacterium]|nr:methyltransferase domain-containing protein [Terriglobales bacterium]